MDLKELAVLTNRLVKEAASEDNESFLYQYRVPISLVAGGLAGAALGTKYAPFLKRKLGTILQFGKTKAKQSKKKATRKSSKTKTKATKETKTQVKNTSKSSTVKPGFRVPRELRRRFKQPVGNTGLNLLELATIYTFQPKKFEGALQKGFITEKQAKAAIRLANQIKQLEKAQGKFFPFYPQPGFIPGKIKNKEFAKFLATD